MLNLTTISSPLFFEVKYKYNDNSDNIKEHLRPKLLNWRVKEFTETNIVFALNISNPSSVSSGLLRDDVMIRINQTMLF